MPYEYPLPRSINPARIQPGALDHPGLAYYRFVPEHLRDDQKAGFLTQLRDRFNGDGPWREACAFEAARLAAAADALRAQGRPVEVIEAKTVTRLLVGMGYKNALEVGLTFHHPGGFPYLPGTSVKGLCRAWAEEVKEADRDLVKKIFGTASKDEKAEAGKMEAGAVCFLDALPVQFPKLDLDLMNPHFSKWYADGEVPGDWQQPVVIPFLAVAPDQRFRFFLVGRTAEDAEAVRKARDWLAEALTDLGAGGKTAAGYGYFEVVEPSSRRDEPSHPAQATRSATPPGSATSPDPASTATSAVPPAAGPSPSSEPKKWQQVRRNSTGVPARVVGHRGRMLVVRLHVAGYEGQDFEVGGVNGPAFAQPGEWVQVDVANVNRQGRVHQLTRPTRRTP